jgi:hypothetical protein
VSAADAAAAAAAAAACVQASALWPMPLATMLMPAHKQQQQHCKSCPSCPALQHLYGFALITRIPGNLQLYLLGS